MSEFRVTPEVLKQKADELKALNSKYETAIDTLKQQENTLKGQWDGEAHDSFHREFIKDVQRLLQFYTAIDEYVQKLNMTAAEYEKAEQKNISTANSRSV